MADYEKINWRNGEEGGTPTSAANFNHMDDGIATAAQAAADAQSAAAAAQSAASRALTPDSTLDMTKIGETTGYSRDLMRVESAAAARTHLGAGTSSLTIGTTGNTAAAGNHKHSYNDLEDRPTIPDVSGLVSQEDFDALAARVAALEAAAEPGE
ncbi:hypothetical protein [Corynebacterium sp.]|uniref:hypothetical protein n=1 Tax=Corynebacterium sp. TaxID=1720 RepID=UPI0025C2447A|nr:hypothetical protein [Corynebacterium sp.]